MKRLSDRIYDSLRSVKLAAALIILIALLAAAGGIIPQGKTDLFYMQKFPSPVARVILATGLGDVFAGGLFLLLSALFTVNLTVCSFHRLARELKKSRADRRHGPDILHVGLLIFIFGGILTARTRTEAFVYLGKGDGASLPDGSRIALTDLSMEYYPDGRAKSWESLIVIEDAPDVAGRVPEASAATVAAADADGDFDTLGDAGYMDPGLRPGGAAVGEPGRREESGILSDPSAAIAVRVNRPLRHGGYTIYQQSWKEELRVILADRAGMRLSLEPGAQARMLEGKVLLMAVEKHDTSGTGGEIRPRYEASFLVEEGSGRRALQASKGDRVGLFTVEGFEATPLSGLNIVRDRGYPLVAAGLALVVFGTFLTYIRKLKGMLS